MRRKKEEARNKLAFTEILGDPFLDIDGAYTTLHFRSSISSIENNYGDTKETVSAAKPSVSDFFCDVENVVNTVIEDKSLLDRFFSTYFYDIQELSKEQCRHLEQRIGRIFRARGISPIKRYFTA